VHKLTGNSQLEEKYWANWGHTCTMYNQSVLLANSSQFG